MTTIQETIVSQAVARITGADPHNPDLLVFIQQEDSMEPEIAKGSIVLVDTAITWHAKDGIYLLNFPGKPGTQFPPSQSIRSVTRRLFSKPSEDEYWIGLANPNYTNHSCSHDLLNIAGLVVGSIRCMTH
ncbi:MAG: S24/S26 family peptidase [Sterolibacterium sp.]|nr:S24/S26 family peptidase [Sterolibacterium sp.]